MLLFFLKVMITIFNQDGGNDIVRGFNRNECYPNDAPFIRSRLLPLREMDEESGFIKDDTLYIKCEVESEEFGKK